MVMNSQQFADLVEGPSRLIFDGRYRDLKPEWPTLYDSAPGKKQRHQDTTVLYGLATAAVKSEGAQLRIDAGGIAYRMRGVFQSYGLMCGVTEEMREDSEALDVIRHFSRELADALNETGEIVHAEPFNRAADPTLVLGDGKPLLAFDHPFAIGGSWSNRLPAAADLSEGSLEELLTMIRRGKNDRGVPKSFRATRLIVGPKNWFNALRILRSTLQSGTTANDVNAIRSSNALPAEPFVLTRLTQDNAYFLQTDAPHGLKHYTRGGVKTGMEVDFTTNNVWLKAWERYLVMVEGARCLWGDMGL
jgi:hypothetical protein